MSLVLLVLVSSFCLSVTAQYQQYSQYPYQQQYQYPYYPSYGGGFNYGFPSYNSYPNYAYPGMSYPYYSG